ncbi:MAG: DivIVA domain-containing protein [Clostridia bacterium]|nr:DivIVA domain-containing protein [Clostridia bacterium]
MSITVAMIEEKEFKTKIKGYDPVEVDEFLDEICDEMVAMQEESAPLNTRLNQASRAAAAYTPVPAPAAVPVPAAAVPVPAPAPAPVQQPAPVQEKKAEEAPKAAAPTSESAVQLLARAQGMYDEIVAEAKAKADDILKNANERANVGIEALEEEKNSLQAEVDMLKAAAKDYKARFLALIEDQQHVLKAETELFE